MKVSLPCWILRILAPILVLILIATSIWAQQHEGLWAALIAIGTTPWGAVTFVDLGSGLLIAGIWMACLEPRRFRTWLLIAFLPLVGNMATLVFISLRCWAVSTVNEAFTRRRNSALDTNPVNA